MWKISLFTVKSSNPDVHGLVTLSGNKAIGRWSVSYWIKKEWKFPSWPKWLLVRVLVTALLSHYSVWNIGSVHEFWAIITLVTRFISAAIDKVPVSDVVIDIYMTCSVAIAKDAWWDAAWAVFSIGWTGGAIVINSLPLGYPFVPVRLSWGYFDFLAYICRLVRRCRWNQGFIIANVPWRLHGRRNRTGNHTVRHWTSYLVRVWADIDAEFFDRLKPMFWTQ